MRMPDTTWLCAVGDINGRTLHPHMGKYQARLAADAILGHDNATSHGANGALSPPVMFTDPQVAAVGHTTDTAARAGLAVDAYDTETSRQPRRLLPRSQRRRAARASSSTASGASSSAARSRATTSPTSCTRPIAVVGELPLERLRHAVPPFPTRSEIWLSLLEHAGV
jgi:pyruvate/2-oxoglutarate dehydrogenase complex dihydrolipoamide dehydrogenase (E3) component